MNTELEYLKKMRELLAMECVCGARFRTMIKEAKHRHNFPLLCKPRKRVKPPKPTKRPQVMEAGR